MVNLRGSLVISQIVVKRMIAHKIHGVIVNVSSQASLKPFESHTCYCASKAALDMATKVMATELGNHSIRINCVNPTVVLTDMGKRAWSDPEKSKCVLSRTPLKRVAEVDDVVNAVLFLLSEKSSMTTGSILPVDGGYISA
ncbi:unnamed protein product [Enterobius vermicularis]|uniref:L-xylulose reductase n=1 Tax=Enterobius vermicularis TaxID=51028 RepID=A0A0N4VHY3_ENTVE|nr:unnamed protein product [Enterobius vermicularis]